MPLPLLRDPDLYQSLLEARALAGTHSGSAAPEVSLTSAVDPADAHNLLEWDMLYPDRAQLGRSGGDVHIVQDGLWKQLFVKWYNLVKQRPDVSTPVPRAPAAASAPSVPPVIRRRQPPYEACQRAIGV